MKTKMKIRTKKKVEFRIKHFYLPSVWSILFESECIINGIKDFSTTMTNLVPRSLAFPIPHPRVAENYCCCCDKPRVAIVSWQSLTESPARLFRIAGVKFINRRCKIERFAVNDTPSTNVFMLKWSDRCDIDNIVGMWSVH